LAEETDSVLNISLLPSEEENAATPKARKPREKKPPKPKKAKPARDLRSAFRAKLREITVESIKKPWMAEKAFRIIDTAEALEAWASGILADASRHHAFMGETCPVIAVDTETTSLDTRIFFDAHEGIVYEVKVEIAGVCLSADGIEGIYVPIHHERGTNVSREDAARILQGLFDRSHLVFYNAKFDREILRICLGLDLRPYPHFEDVQVLKYINDPKADLGDKGQYTGDAGGLKALSETVLGIQQVELDDLAKVRAHKWNEETQKNALKDQFVPFTWIPIELALWYAAADAICTWLLWNRMKDLARSRKLIHRIDHELVDSLTFLERQRFNIDVPRLRRTSRWHTKKTEQFAQKLREMAVVAGWQEEFNPGSPAQLSKLLFTTMKFKPYRTTDGGSDSTDKETIIELLKGSPDNEFLLTYKKFKEYAALHPENLKFDKLDNSARMYLKQNVVGGGRLSGAGGVFERDGGFELNPQGVKKLEPDEQWRVYGNVLDPDEIPTDQVDAYEESDLHPSCFHTEEEDVITGYTEATVKHTLTEWSEEVAVPVPPQPIKEKRIVKKKAPGIVNNHIGQYQGYAICLVPKCQTCKDKFGILIANTSMDSLETVNLRCLFVAQGGWTFFSIDYCVSMSTKLLTSDLRWKQAKDVVEGEELIGFDENLPSTRYGRRRMRGSRVLSTKNLKLPCVKITTNSGVFTVSEDHGWLTERAAGGRKLVRGRHGWTVSKNLQVGDKIARLCDPWEENRSYDAGYLNGLFDGEGWATGTGVGVGQKKGPTLDKAELLLEGMGYTLAHDTHKSNVERLRILGGRNASLKFLGSVRPERLIKNARKKLWDGKTCSSKYTIPDTVISVEHIGMQEVVAIKTSTKTFIAEGLLSHNCNIEVREAANLSGEPELQKIFLEGDGDQHALTASKVFPQYNDPNSPQYKAKSLRGLGKIINFVLQYGGTAYAIYENMSKKDPTITMEKCEEMIANYWKGVPKYAEWCAIKRNRARLQLVCETATGRVINFESAMQAKCIHKPSAEERRNVSKYYDLSREAKAEAKKSKADRDEERAKRYKDAADRLWKTPDTGVRNAIEYNKFMGKIERVAVNAPIQGICGDFMRIAVNRIRMWVLSDPDVQKVFRLHGSVHDEIDASIKNEYVPFVLPRLTRLMKLRKYHAQMKWPVPVEADAEYGRSWDVDFSVMDKKYPYGYTCIDGISGYIPSDFDVPTIRNLLKAILSGDKSRVDKAKEWLYANLHPRAFEATTALFKTQDPKEAKQLLTAVCQLHEYWAIDYTPDDDGSKLEKLADYETRMGLGEANRGTAPEFGFLGAIPLDARVKRPVLELLGDEPPPEQGVLQLSADEEVVEEEVPVS
jgi:DNA polymerase I-like protein with 3'-5' exonuclease and polymerase domains